MPKRIYLGRNAPTGQGVIDSGVREFSSEAVQQCLVWLRGGSPLRAAISRLVRAMLRFDVLRRRRMKDWMTDSESTDRKDSAV